MAHVFLNLRELPVSEKVALARRILSAMSDNVHFPTPDPPLVLLNRLTNDLDVHRDSKNESLLDETLGRLSSYVARVSVGSEEIIRSAGMDIEAADGYHGVPLKPTNLVLTHGRSELDIHLRCDAVLGAKTYVFQSTADPLTTSSAWIIGSVSTGNSGTISGLTPGMIYWFRVSAVGPLGQGPWSDPVSEMVQ